jgi:hypothetical protein
MRHEADGERIAPRFDRRQTDAIDRNLTLISDKSHPVFRRLKPEHLIVSRNHLAHGIDVTQNEVPADRIPRTQRGLKIHGIAHPQTAELGPRKGFLG